jgi:cation diffusion facilitator family transporter
MHARTDGLTSLGVVGGAIGVALGFPLADPIVGLVIACAIGAVLMVVARDVFRRLLDGVEPELVATAHRTLAERSDVRAVRQVRMRWIGHQLEADVELDVDSRLTLAEAHRLAHDAEHELAHAIPKLSHAIVHAYPAHEPALSS